jgi:putative Mg2+ transporter-C (MgtC) family protein
LGSTILLLAARNAANAFGGSLEEARLVLDPNRISAGIVTGIGFLGAGAIIRMGDLVRGLTTAACIWFVAALGIIIGNGLYTIAVVATLFVLLVLIVFDRLEHAVPALAYRSLLVSIDTERREEFEHWCRAFLAKNGIRTLETLHRYDSASCESEVVFQLRARGSPKTGALVESIGRQPGVHRVHWDLA